MKKKIIVKYCKRCDKDKPATDFYYNKWSKDKLGSYCSGCAKEVSRVQRQQFGKEYFAEAQKKHKNKDPESYRLYHDKYNESEEYKQSRKEYYQANKHLWKERYRKSCEKKVLLLAAKGNIRTKEGKPKK